MLITALFEFRVQSHWEPRNEIGSLFPMEREKLPPKHGMLESRKYGACNKIIRAPLFFEENENNSLLLSVLYRVRHDGNKRNYKESTKNNPTIS